MKIALEWLGVATFRLTLGETVVFLDAYMDRLPTAPPVGRTTAEVTAADWILVGHSHFDHLAGAEVIAKNTGARIIGSNETCRVMREKGVPGAQLLASQGGERHRLAPGVTVRVFPSLHACTWTHSPWDAAAIEVGQLGLTEDERSALHGLPAEIRRAAAAGTPEAQALVKHMLGATGSFSDGGALVYLIETAAGTIFIQDTSGYWTGVLRMLDADVAILAASGRGNVDGEPTQGSLAQFIATEAELLRPKTVVLAHHDNWLPPVTQEGGIDTAPIRAELTRRAPAARLAEPRYLEPVAILG